MFNTRNVLGKRNAGSSGPVKDVKRRRTQTQEDIHDPVCPIKQTTHDNEFITQSTLGKRKAGSSALGEDVQRGRTQTQEATRSPVCPIKLTTHGYEVHLENRALANTPSETSRTLIATTTPGPPTLDYHVLWHGWLRFKQKPEWSYVPKWHQDMIADIIAQLGLLDEQQKMLLLAFSGPAAPASRPTWPGYLVRVQECWLDLKRRVDWSVYPLDTMILVAMAVGEISVLTDTEVSGLLALEDKNGL